MAEKRNTLEEASEEYEKNHTRQQYDGGGFTPEYNATLAEAFIAGAEWQAEHTEDYPMPEDTVLFQKGVEEGKRLMMEDAVDGKVAYFERKEVAVVHYDDPIGDTMCYFAPSDRLEVGDKVKIIIVKEDEK